MNGHLSISQEAFPYLVAQRGRISDLADCREDWTAAYFKTLEEDFHDIQPWLPEKCSAVLDVGGGMGGINILIGRRNPGMCVYILDGAKSDPVAVRHYEPFNDMDVARGFLRLNGIHDVVGITPRLEIQPPPKCDLIISLQSWCFHFNPETYLDYVAACAHAETVLILDVRKDYKTWRRVLRARFHEAGALREESKFERVLFRAA